jgi:sortase A
MAAQKNPLKNPKILRLIANGLIAVGIIGAAAIAYQVWGTNVTSAVLAQQERTALQIEFSKPNNLVPSLVEPEASKSFALVTIPKLKVKDFPLVQGIEERDLAKGIGHYPGTAMPGGLGNFAIAGHRAGNGEPFAEFEKLVAGDKIFVKTADATYVYSLEYDTMVKPSGTWVIDKNPKNMPVDNTRKLITLTTCDPKWNSTHRWVWWGSLSEIIPN